MSGRWAKACTPATQSLKRPPNLSPSTSLPVVASRCTILSGTYAIISAPERATMATDMASRWGELPDHPHHQEELNEGVELLGDRQHAEHPNNHAAPDHEQQPPHEESAPAPKPARDQEGEESHAQRERARCPGHDRHAGQHDHSFPWHRENEAPQGGIREGSH